MKLFSLLPIASLVSLGLVSGAADITVTSGIDGVKSTAVLSQTAAGIQFCPTGACDTLSFKIELAKITEYDGANAIAAHTVTSVNTDTTAAWGTTPTQETQDGKTIDKWYKFSGALKNSARVSLGELQLTAFYYYVAMDPDSANPIPAGSLVLQVEILGWTFDGADTVNDNTVKVDLVITSTSKAGTGVPTVPTMAQASDGESSLITIGDGMVYKTPNSVGTIRGSERDGFDVTPILMSSSPFTLTYSIPNFNGATVFWQSLMYSTSPATTGGATTGGTTTGGTTTGGTTTGGTTTGGNTTNTTNSSTPTPSSSSASTVWGFVASALVSLIATSAVVF